jgi:hypothetical protein
VLLVSYRPSPDERAQSELLLACGGLSVVAIIALSTATGLIITLLVVNEV